MVVVETNDPDITSFTLPVAVGWTGCCGRLVQLCPTMMDEWFVGDIVGSERGAAEIDPDLFDQVMATVDETTPGTLECMPNIKGAITRVTHPW